MIQRLHVTTCCLLFGGFLIFANTTQGISLSKVGSRPAAKTTAPIPKAVTLRIVKAEDERRWDNDLSSLLADPSPAVRRRAALAAGRIGDERAVSPLISMLQKDEDDDVRSMAAFALGETESAVAGDALIAELAKRDGPGVRARVVEALGKITAALPATDEARLKSFRREVYSALAFEAGRRSAPDTEVILAGLTAVLRARPENVGKVVAEFLSYSDPRVRADAANTLTRLRARDGNEQLRKLLNSDPDPIVRANAARVLGATEDKEAFDALVDLATKDQDSRVRVSAVRALAALKDQEPRVANALASMGCERKLLKTGGMLYHQRDAECLELVTALGRVFQGTDDKQVLASLDHWGWDFLGSPPELAVAMVRISPVTYLAKFGDEAAAKRKVQGTILSDWREASSLAQALGEIATLAESTKDKKQLLSKAEALLRAMLDYRNSGFNITLNAVHSEYAIPDVLRAFAAFKPNDLSATLRNYLKASDAVIRATAAELLGELPPDETNASALAVALETALRDKELNDAALATLDALGKQKNGAANEALKTALASSDHLLRRRAVALLKENGVGDFSSQIGTVQTRNTMADYERAIARIGKNVRAIIATSKGYFAIELLPEAAPLNIDNFVRLAKRGYFRGITFHRVVPNFVLQAGDPRGDGNGGPGYQIRCEINEVPYDRGAVGMALSGKDTGGSQWFVTHSPQPHLDGGYTVFGRVVAGMEVVDSIIRGDVIRSIVVTERPRRG